MNRSIVRIPTLRFVLGLGMSLAAAACGRTEAPAREATSRAETARPAAARFEPTVREFALTVASLPKSVEFFRGLDFVEVERRTYSGPALDALLDLTHVEMRTVRMRLGLENIELREFVAPVGRDIPPDTRSNDQAFQHLAIVVSDMDAAYARLQRQEAEPVSPSPQTIPLSNSAAGGIRAFYFRDVDRHNLELIWFPPGKGRRRWQTDKTRTFLGIDHSAIAVTRTGMSRQFYEGLEFMVAGRSFNFGAEQEALSGVPGARVRITSLAAKTGPSVEFLSYVAPGPGRPVPANSASNDLWHWEVVVAVQDLEGAVRSATGNGGHLVSRGIADVELPDYGYSRAALVQDVDGHALRLVER